MALNKLNHIDGEPRVVSSLNTTGDTVVSGSLRVIGSTTLASASIGAVTAGQIQYLAGLTSDVQTQLDGKVTAAQVAANYQAFIDLQKNETLGALFRENLNPVGDRKFLFCG